MILEREAEPRNETEHGRKKERERERKGECDGSRTYILSLI